MADYNYGGYTAPEGVGSRVDVKDIQRQLNAMGAGLSTDGLWGPKTQAAYDQYMGSGAKAATPSLVPADYSAMLKEVQGMIAPQKVNYNAMSRADIEAGIRPHYDLAMEGRRAQTKTNKANIDVDAASRGMGTSTWVTDVKNRQQNAEASDIAGLEAQLQQQVLAGLQQERANQLSVDQYNAGLDAQALQTALSLTGNLYNQRMTEQQQAAAKSSGGSGRSSGGGSGASSLIEALARTHGTDYQATLNDIHKNRDKYFEKYSPETVGVAMTAISNLWEDQRGW